MRSDYKYLIKGGHSNGKIRYRDYNRAKFAQSLQRIRATLCDSEYGWDHEDSFCSMQTGGYWKDSFYLSPLKRLCATAQMRGLSADDVWSMICAQSDARSFIGHMLRRFFLWECTFEDCPPRCFGANPRFPIWDTWEYRKPRYKNADPVLFTIPGTKIKYAQINGIWYRIWFLTYEQFKKECDCYPKIIVNGFCYYYPEQRVRSKYCGRQGWIDIDGATDDWKERRKYYIYRKEQANKKEVKKIRRYGTSC